MYNRHRSALGLVYLSGSTVTFCYYLLGGDTAAPSGLYARLCHAFLVLIFIFLVLAKRLAVKSVSDMTFLVSSGTLNLNSVNHIRY